MRTVIFLQKNKPDGLFQTVDKLEEKPVCLQFFIKTIPIDFSNPLPFRRLSAKPPRRKRLWGLG
jgi:hypothetical protein